MGEDLLGSANRGRLQNILPSLPRRYTFGDIAASLGPALTRPVRYETRCYAALEVFARLSQPERIDSLDHAADDAAAQGLAESLVTGLLPLPPVGDHPSQAPVVEAGLACLQLLSTTWSCSLDNTSLLSIVHYTDPSDQWTTEKAATLASGLLDQHLAGAELGEFIAGPLLQTYLRPIFSKSSARVTTSGRPSHFRDPADNSTNHMAPPAWKLAGLQVVSDFHWAVRAADADILAKNWPLFTPVLLALAEDPESDIRARGLEILVIFLDKCPGQILQSTGIATVFQEAVLPTLLHLPSLTPEPSSVKLLEPAYRALVAIAKMDTEQSNTRRRRLLNTLLRDGIFAGHHHASQHIGIVQVLMHHAEVIVGCLGIFAVKHLANLLPLFASVMTDPFAVAHPPAILAASKALNTTLANCWPRISETQHAGQVMRMIILCWLNLHDGGVVSQPTATESDEITKELVLTAMFLESLWEQRELEPPSKWNEVLERKPELAKLFPALGNRLAAKAS